MAEASIASHVSDEQTTGQGWHVPVSSSMLHLKSGKKGREEGDCRAGDSGEQRVVGEVGCLDAFEPTKTHNHLERNSRYEAGSCDYRFGHPVNKDGKDSH